MKKTLIAPLTFFLACGFAYGDEIELPNHQGTIALSPDSKALLVPGTPPTLRLAQGTAWVTVTQSNLILQGPSGAVQAQGGKLAVTAQASANRISVLCLEGSAEFQNPAGHSVTLAPGQFSGISSSNAEPLLPVRISPAQIETLRLGFGKNTPTESPKPGAIPLSPVPPGVAPKFFATSPKIPGTQFPLPHVEGTTTVIPGGYVDLPHGLYIAPPPGSPYDPVTGLYVPPRNMGSFDRTTGAYLPPAGASLENAPGLVLGQSQTGKSMTAPPLPPGSDPGKSNTSPLQVPTVATEEKFIPYYQNGRPEFPVYDPGICPPYCGPVLQPSHPPADPSVTQPSGPTRVIFNVQ